MMHDENGRFEEYPMEKIKVLKFGMQVNYP